LYQNTEVTLGDLSSPDTLRLQLVTIVPVIHNFLDKDLLDTILNHFRLPRIATS